MYTITVLYLLQQQLIKSIFFFISSLFLSLLWVLVNQVRRQSKNDLAREVAEMGKEDDAVESEKELELLEPRKEDETYHLEGKSDQLAPSTSNMKQL